MRKKTDYQKRLENLPPDQQGDGKVEFKKEDIAKLKKIGPHVKWSSIPVIQRKLWGKSQ